MKSVKPDSGPQLQRALANLEREIAQTATPAGTEGPVDSPLVTAIANTVAAYVRWRLDVSRE